jgi:hypothetical protein
MPLSSYVPFVPESRLAACVASDAVASVVVAEPAVSSWACGSVPASASSAYALGGAATAPSAAAVAAATIRLVAFVVGFSPVLLVPCMVLAHPFPEWPSAGRMHADGADAASPQACDAHAEDRIWLASRNLSIPLELDSYWWSFLAARLAGALGEAERIASRVPDDALG